MSMTGVRSYLRARAKAIALKEWTDGFNWQNNPSSIVDNSFHLEMGQLVGLKQNHTDLEMSFPVTVRIFKKGFRDPASGIDSVISIVEDFVQESLRASVRLTQPGIKNISCDSVSFDPFSESNDNLIVASVNLRVFLIQDIPNS